MKTYTIKYNGTVLCQCRTLAAAAEIVANFPAILGLEIIEE
jgi:hypothetical protein